MIRPLALDALRMAQDVGGVKVSLALALSLLLWPATAAWLGKVVGVSDGNTITVLHNGQAKKIRPCGIDCPEKNQDFGTKAKHITSTLVFAKVVEVDPVTVDRYGMTMACVKVADTVVNEELIRQGLARVFTRYCDRAICERWERLEAEAREARRGLWCMPNAIPPWEFRRSRR
jgi:endonuclease YncB( thermonuclease family)